MVNKILTAIIKAISSLPFKVHFIFSWIFYLLLCYVLQYRRKVIDENLSKSFPLKTKKERNNIRKQFYRRFSFFIVETLKLITISQRQLEKKIHISDAIVEEIKSRFKRKENIIVLSGHTFNWEYCCLFPAKSDYRVVVSYKILNNAFWEKIIKNMRQRFGGIAVDFRKTYLTLLRSKKEKQLTLTWICGDQMPIWDKNALVEEDFLNQKTYFFDGINEIVRRTNATVYFVGLRRKSTFVYEADLKLITDQPNEQHKNFVTQQYAALLEKHILEDPSNWLWSHKRWKKVSEQSNLQ